MYFWVALYDPICAVDKPQADSWVGSLSQAQALDYWPGPRNVTSPAMRKTSTASSTVIRVRTNDEVLRNAIYGTIDLALGTLDSLNLGGPFEEARGEAEN